MTKTLTVLIGFAEALAAPEVAWSLVDAGFKVVAFSRRGRRAALKASRLVQVFEVTPPESNPARTEEDLRTIIFSQRDSSKGPVAVMPLDDGALWLCGRGRVCDETRALWVGPEIWRLTAPWINVCRSTTRGRAVWQCRLADLLIVPRMSPSRRWTFGCRRYLSPLWPPRDGTGFF